MDSKISAANDFKRIHLVGVIWLFLCLMYLVVITLYQGGFQLWLIFSISGYSLPVVMFLFLVYLFAVYKGVVRNLNSIEHPLTTSPYYVLLYDLSPLLGAATGIWMGTTTSQVRLSMFTAAAQGTLILTFLMWIVIDSVVDLIEASFPQSRSHRNQRLAENRARKSEEIASRQQLLDQVIQQSEQKEVEWSRMFGPLASEVTDLLCDPAVNIQTAKQRIVELGAQAWRTDGQLSMIFFHKVILDELKNRPRKPAVDFVTLYWDGIGTWRKPSKLDKMYM